MSKSKVLVKVHPEGRYVVGLDKSIDINKVTVGARVALRNDSYTLHVLLPTKARAAAASCLSADSCRQPLAAHLRCEAGLAALLSTAQPRVVQVDPLVSLMKVEKVPDSTYDMVGGLDQQIKEIKEVCPCTRTQHMLTRTPSAACLSS